MFSLSRDALSCPRRHLHKNCSHLILVDRTLKKFINNSILRGLCPNFSKIHSRFGCVSGYLIYRSHVKWCYVALPECVSDVNGRPERSNGYRKDILYRALFYIRQMYDKYPMTQRFLFCFVFFLFFQSLHGRVERAVEIMKGKMFLFFWLLFNVGI